MRLKTAVSINKIKIRLTDERWRHIISYHKEFDLGDSRKILASVKTPDVIFSGQKGEFLAAKNYGNKRWVVVVYRELNKKDGFVITAYVTTDVKWLFKRKIIWTKK